jgi:hypothetical protein
VGDDSIRDSGRVVLSFLRAYAPWVDARFGLLVDPRCKHGMDYQLSLHDLSSWLSGTSASTALAGAAPTT